VALLSQGRTAAAQCGLFTHKSVPVIFEPPSINTPCFVATCNSAMGILIELIVFIVYKVTGSNRKEVCSYCTEEECWESADW